MPTKSDDYYQLGDHHCPVNTTSPLSQLWFDRGLIWCYGFNHDEAASCFEKAIAHDNNCVMAYWGLAYCLGPNYNKPWDLFGRRERHVVTEKAHRAAVWARAILSHRDSVHSIRSRTNTSGGQGETSSPSPPSGVNYEKELGLVEAQLKRYPREQAPGKSDCHQWNVQYADAMSDVYARFSDDLDVAALYADAMMNLAPWQLWDLKTGDPFAKARTLKIKQVLERGLGSPGGMQHPGLLHLYIHLMENSTTPEAAMPAANKLRNLVPDAGHLNHMPSHLDILVGDYANAIAANTSAILADEKYLTCEGPMNFYTLYRCHDYHFRLYAALFCGKSVVALDTVAKLEATISDEILRVENPPMADWLESFLAMRVHALVRFGRWRDIIDLPLPADQDLYCVTTALTYYAKGLAYAALHRLSDAQHQLHLFRASVPNVKPTRTLFNNKCVDILGVAEAMLDGEVEYRAGHFGAAFSHLRISCEKYDNLPFDEPWGWMQPTRHAYGALLLEQGHVEEAMAVYSADLGLDESLPRQQRHPKNVWALHGYHECLVKLGRVDEAGKLWEKQLRRALDEADVPIKASCFCRRTATARM